MDNLDRTEEFITKLPREIADEIRKDAELQENDKNFQRSNISTEGICDYIALSYFPEMVLRYEFFPEYSSKFQLWSELQDRIIAASFDEIMSLCKFIGSRRKLLEKYGFIASVLLAFLTIRTDKKEIFKRLDENDGFELLGEQNKREKFVQLSQKSQKITKTFIKIVAIFRNLCYNIITGKAASRLTLYYSKEALLWATRSLLSHGNTEAADGRSARSLPRLSAWSSSTISCSM